MWGGLLLLVLVGDVLREGARPALARLLPSRGASLWGWLNALSAGLALGVGVVVAGVWLWGLASASKSERSEE